MGDPWRPARAVLFLATAILSLMTIAPLLWMVSMAFKDSNEVFGTNLIPHRPTLDNLLYVFTKVDFFRFLLNTLFVSATVTSWSAERAFWMTTLPKSLRATPRVGEFHWANPQPMRYW